MLRVIKVAGESLSPFFLPGDYVITFRSPSLLGRLKQGDIVAAEHPELGRIIKQVTQNHLAGEYLELAGTNPASVSSHKIGKVPYRNILGKVLFHFKKPR